jgi:uncharacterized membrane protein YraQ (UPF0718 family)
MKINKTTQGLALAVAISVVIALATGGFPLLIEGLTKAGQIVWQSTLLVIAAFALSGLIQVAIEGKDVSQLLGRKAGPKAIWIGVITGALIPGGPLTYGPIVRALFVGGAGIGTAIAILLGKNLLSLSRFPVEFAIMGTKATLVRFSVTFFFPILFGLLASRLYKGIEEDLRKDLKALQEEGGRK